MVRRSSRDRQFFGRFRKRMGKCIRQLCCFVSATEDDHGVRRSHALTVADLKMFHETDVEGRISCSTSSWSLEEGIPQVTYHPVFPSRHNGMDDDGTSECMSTSSDCYSLSDAGCIIDVHREDNESDDSFSTVSLLEFLQTMEDEDSSTYLSSSDEDDDDTLTIVSDMSDFDSSLFGSDDEDIEDAFTVDLNQSDELDIYASTATKFLDELTDEVALRMNL